MKRKRSSAPRWRRCAALAAATSLATAAAALAMEPPGERQPGQTPQVSETPVPPPTRVIVKYVEDAGDRLDSPQGAENSAQTLSGIAGVEMRNVRPMSGNAQLVEVVPLATGQAGDAAQQTLDDIIERLEADPSVEYAEPDVTMVTQQAVNDPRYGEQWHYTDPAAGVDVEDAWPVTGGAGAVVAVIDSGVIAHGDLQANVLPGFDFISDVANANDGDGRDSDASDPGNWRTATTCPPAQPRDSSWHGTHVAGTIAAVTNNATGVAGVARDASILPVRALGRCGGSISDIVDAMRWSAGLPVPGVANNPNPAQVINMSLGGGGACFNSYQDAIDDVLAENVTVVVSAGNSNDDAANYQPASCTGVITVAATNEDGARSWYSNFGATVEIAAPGGETFIGDVDGGVLSTVNSGTTTPVGDDYAFYQGTSMAAPHVAAVAALLYAVDPSTTPATVLSRLQSTVKPFPSVPSNQCSTSNCGSGILDAGDAVATPAKTSSTSWLKLLLKD